MTPTSVSAILQLDYPDRLPKGKHTASTSVRINWMRGAPLVRGWVLRLMLS